MYFVLKISAGIRKKIVKDRGGKRNKERQREREIQREKERQSERERDDR